MVKEFSVPAIAPEPSVGSMLDHIIANAKQYPDRVAISRLVDGAWTPMTSAELLAEVKAVAKGLVANGIQHGDRIGIMARTCYEWTIVDYAIWYAGAISVPIYETSAAEQVRWIISDSGAVAIFMESRKNKAVFDEVAVDLPNCTRSWVFDDDALGELKRAGAGVDDAELEARREALSPRSLATIIYTSGTTGRPKGCVLTHSNFMFEVENVVQGLKEVFFAPNSSTLLFLPVAHIFGRVIQGGCIRAGVRLGHGPDLKQAVADLQTFQPTFLLAVPRVFEKVYNSALQKATADGKGHIFEVAAATAIEYSKEQRGGGAGLMLKLKHALFDKLVYHKIRAAMGGKVRWAVSGSAPLGARLGHFFDGIGVTILEGYGLTETTAATTVNRPDAIRIGTVGQPIPGAAVKVAEDGELLLRGGQVFVEYWNNPGATAEAFTDGWFHSGDIGEIDDAGFVKITGRKKELIVTAGGKNVAPAVLEDRIRAHWLVSQCLVVGDARPFIGALITVDPEAFPAWKKQAGKPEGASIADLADDPDLRAAIQEAVDNGNKIVSHAEQIKKFAILRHDWSEEGGQMTPSLKIKRNVVLKENEADIEALYS